MNEGWLSYKSPACQLLSVCMIFRLSAAEQVGIMYNALLHAAVPFASFMCWKFSQNDCGTSINVIDLFLEDVIDLFLEDVN